MRAIEERSDLRSIEGRGLSDRAEILKVAETACGRANRLKISLIYGLADIEIALFGQCHFGVVAQYAEAAAIFEIDESHFFDFARPDFLRCGEHQLHRK